MKKVIIILGVMSALILNTSALAHKKDAVNLRLIKPKLLPENNTGNYQLTYDSDSEAFSWTSSVYKIGHTGPMGGIVFYTSDGGLHGLEAAPEDLLVADFGCYGTDISGADGTAIGTGKQNTVDILADCNEDRIAANYAANYVWPNGQADGFLPSKDELNLMWKNLADSDGNGENTGLSDPYNLGGFATANYWSSSESNSDFAWIQSFANGIYFDIRKDGGLNVRAVRAF